MQKAGKMGKKRYIGVILGCLMVSAALSGCQSTEPEEITVTLMNNEETVATLTGEADTLLEGFEEYESLPGYEFLGWYETPTFLESSRKDLHSDVFGQDETLYGYFKPEEAAEDSRSWYIVGTGTSEVLAATNWASVPVEDVQDIAQLKPTGNAKNEFSITLDLYSGDQFQLIPDWSWDGQLGYGYFTEIDETQMESGGSLEGSEKKANVNVLVDGNYTITLTTNPDNIAQTTISIVRNGDIG